MRLSQWILIGALSVSPILVQPVSARAAALPAFATPGTTAQFQLADKTQVPGQLLKKGSYSITVLDHLTDRMVLRVTSSDGKELTTFLALPGGARISNRPAQGPIKVNLGKGTEALRGFVFADGSVAEFVYPKDEAVSLAKANNVTVPAIDPASEGRPAASALSHTDMELVTLWMLTPTTVGAEPGIEAKRYQAEVAESSAPPALPAPAGSGHARTAPPAAEAAVKPKKVAHPIATLPHTASELPMLAGVGFGCLLAAAMLGARRMRSDG